MPYPQTLLLLRLLPTESNQMKGSDSAMQLRSMSVDSGTTEEPPLLDRRDSSGPAPALSGTVPPPPQVSLPCGVATSFRLLRRACSERAVQQGGQRAPDHRAHLPELPLHPHQGLRGSPPGAGIPYAAPETEIQTADDSR
jgi:hypothetical protein